MNASRRALLMSGGAMALGPLVGCSSLVPDPLVPDLLLFVELVEAHSAADSRSVTSFAADLR